MFIYALGIAQERCGAKAPHSGNFESWIEKVRHNTFHKSNTKKNEVYEIPIVVHVLHMGESIGEGVNLSKERIYAQIDSLNADFRRINADTVNTPERFDSVAVDTHIQFVFARQDPNGEPTDGIVRVNASRLFNSFNKNDLFSMRSFSYWPASNYLNIYCADLKSGSLDLIGSAIFPETNEIDGLDPEGDQFYLDGVFVDYKYFGNNPDAPAFESRGRTLTHEAGHFLGLRHIWGDGGCGFDDFVADTPFADDDNDGYSSPCTFPNPEDKTVCIEDEPEMFQNYMDYTDDVCMNLFTRGQKERMRIVLEHSPRRASLLHSPALTAPPQNEVDLAIVSIASPDRAECTNQITPIVRLKNMGTEEITQYEIALFIDDVEIFRRNKATNLLPFESEEMSFPNQIISGKQAKISFLITEVNESFDVHADNNEQNLLLNYTSSINLPYVQDFEEGTNLQGSIGTNAAWNIALAPNNIPSNRSLVLQSFENDYSFGDELELTTPPLDLNAVITATISFSYAYSGTPAGIYDGLIVKGSKDCGMSYPDILFSSAGVDLQTVVPTTSQYVPSNELEWQDVTLNISDYQDTDGVRFKFQGINGSNNIYLDNIIIEQSNILEDDISLEAIRGPLITCNDKVDLELEVKNAGSEPIRSFSVDGLVNGLPLTKSFEGIFIQYQEYQTFDISISSLNQIENTVSLHVGQVNGRTDESSISNSVETPIKINADEDEYPLLLDFERNHLWTNTSPQKTSLWVEEKVNENTALKVNGFSEATLGIQSWFVSPALSTGGLDSAGLSFKLSYANRPGFNDQFRILLSYNCGKTFEEVLFEANSDSLAITESSNEWIPSSPSDWQEFSLDLSQTISKDSLRLAFIMINGNGNNLYLDDIHISGNEQPNYKDIFRLYPNPAKGNFNVGFNLSKKESVLVEMLDLSGKVILSKKIPNAFNQVIPFKSPKNQGLYFIRISNENFAQAQKLFVTPN